MDVVPWPSSPVSLTSPPLLSLLIMEQEGGEGRGEGARERQVIEVKGWLGMGAHQHRLQQLCGICVDGAAMGRCH